METSAMRTLALVSLLLASGCGASSPPPGSGAPTGTPTTGTTGGSTTTTSTTDTLNSYGSVMLVRRDLGGPAPTSELVAVFPDTDPGYANLAQCGVLDWPCLPQLPDVEDGYIDIDPDRTFDATSFDYTFAGVSIGLGPLSAFYQNGNVPYYYANLGSEVGLEGFDGTYGLRLGGQFGDQRGFDDLVVSPMLRMMSHEGGQMMPFHDGQLLVFEWEPRGEGDVYLYLNAGTVMSRMYLLEDDGYFELRADDLALGVEDLELKITMSRWNRERVEIGESEIDVISVSDVQWDALWFFVEGRDQLVPVDTCGDTASMDVVTTGRYWGRLADWGFQDDMNLQYGWSCTTFLTAGEEGFIRFDLPPRTFFSATFALLEEDAALYLLRDCTNGQSCIQGSDQTFYGGGEETVTYFNGTETTETVYLVLDGWEVATGLFYADISVNTMVPPVLYDTCTDASSGPPLPAGGYYSNDTAFTNQLDPATGGCTPTSNPGPEALTRIEVGAGETVSVNVDMFGADPAIYLLYNCSNTNSCAAGSDADVGPIESVQYTNFTGTTETLYLVVDSKTQLQPWFMTVDIQ